MRPLPLKPLSDKEIDRLDAYLASLGPAAMNVEIIDGFFTALLCGPDLIKPIEWMPEIWGGKASIGSEQEALKIVDLLFRHWNVVADELTCAADDPEARQLLLAEDDNGIVKANDWAHGFICGVLLREDDWTPMFEDEERMRWMEPILMLHHEDDPDPKLRTPPISDEDRKVLLYVLNMAVAQIYTYLEPYRRARDEQAMQASVRRQAPKIGRNDPCPCGSGKKYKQCCGAEPTVH